MPSTVLGPDQTQSQPQELFSFDAYKGNSLVSIFTCTSFCIVPGDIMWMSPQWFQTHQLRNVSSDYCATINCYRYDTQDCQRNFAEVITAGSFSKEKAADEILSYVLL